LPDAATTTGAAIPLASTSAGNDSAPALASMARSAQDGARIDVGDAKRDARISDAAAATAVGAEAARRASSDDKLTLQKDSPDRIEQRFEVPSFRDLAATSHPAGATAPSQIDNTAAPVSVNVATPAASPQFNEALGVQVSVLARDGVQHAQLHLNPSEMGPISVQIALDGTRAQVDFGADSLATRQIIESGLPELASALRDAGFTLAGGGVSQHSSGQANRDGGEHQSGNASRRVNASGEVQTSAPRRSTVRMSQGGVDLYA
jgi:flagellar hook-length control protein FliK